jgi:stage II sporulation protein M
LTKEYIFEKHSVKVWFMLFAAVFVIGVIIGAIYCTCISGDSAQGLYQYLNDFMSGFKTECFRVFKDGIRKNAVLALILFVCGFFKAGLAVNTAVTGVKGFCAGFTAAALVQYYGGKGILLSLADLPSMLLFIPAFLLFCAFSAKHAVTRTNDRHRIIIYVGIALCTMAIFCVSSFTEGYVNTIFMNFLIQKLLVTA